MLDQPTEPPPPFPHPPSEETPQKFPSLRNQFSHELCFKRFAMLEDQNVKIVAMLEETKARLDVESHAMALLRVQVANLGARVATCQPKASRSPQPSSLSGSPEAGEKFQLDGVHVVHPNHGTRLKTLGTLDTAETQPASSNEEPRPHVSIRAFGRDIGSQAAVDEIPRGRGNKCLAQPDQPESCREVSIGSSRLKGSQSGQQSADDKIGTAHAKEDGRGPDTPVRHAFDNGRFKTCGPSSDGSSFDSRAYMAFAVASASPATVPEAVSQNVVPVNANEAAPDSLQLHAHHAAPASTEEDTEGGTRADGARPAVASESCCSQQNSFFSRDIFPCMASESTCGQGTPKNVRSGQESGRAAHSVAATRSCGVKNIHGRDKTAADHDLSPVMRLYDKNSLSPAAQELVNEKLRPLPSASAAAHTSREITASGKEGSSSSKTGHGVSCAESFQNPARAPSRERESRNGAALASHVPGDSIFIYDEEELSREMLATRGRSTSRHDMDTASDRTACRDSARSSSRTDVRRASTVLPAGAADAARFTTLEANGVAFLYDAARLDGRTCKLRATMASGGCSVIRVLRMRDRAQQEAVDTFTDKSGLVVKKASQTAPRFQKDAMRRELAIVKSLVPGCHPNVVDYLSYSMDNLAIVMKAEPCDLQDLLALKFPLEAMGRGGRLRFFAGGIRGLMHLHNNGYTHMDCKPANLMADKDMSKLKIADMGFAGRSREDRSMGGTKEYMAPETMGHHRDMHTPRALLDPSIDTWAVGIMLLQILFVQELPRTDPNELVIHGLMPKQEPFLVSLRNVEYLTAQAEESGSVDDQLRMVQAESAHNILLSDYAIQQVKMHKDLTTSLLCRGKWEEPEGLRYHEEVTRLLVSLLDPNPLRRLPLGEVLPLLECDALWREADSELVDLPAPAHRFFANLDARLPTHEQASRGVWWPSNPWWTSPPAVSLIAELR